MRKNIFILIMCSVVFTFFSCAKKKDVIVSDTRVDEAAVVADSAMVEVLESDTFLIYQRGACFGMCPIFNLVVYEDGKAIYEGRNFVDLIGFYQTKMDATALQKILDQANSIGYFGLQDEYDNPNVTDLPTTRTGILHNGKLKMVSNRYKGPPALKQLYTELDRIIAEQKWTPVNN